MPCSELLHPELRSQTRGPIGLHHNSYTLASCWFPTLLRPRFNLDTATNQEQH